MKHASDRELLDMLAAGRPAPDDLAGHLDHCAECRQRLDEYFETWDLLRRVEPEDIPADLASGILRAAGQESRGRQGVVARLWEYVGPIGRAAAIIVVASAIGFAMGRFTAPRGGENVPAAVPITSQEAAEAVFFDELATAPLGIGEALDLATLPAEQEHE